MIPVLHSFFLNYLAEELKSWLKLLSAGVNDLLAVIKEKKKKNVFPFKTFNRQTVFATFIASG